MTEPPTNAATPGDATDPLYVNAVLRALRLLDCFKHGHPQLALGDFVRETGYSKTTSYRLLTTLEHAGWLERTRDAGFRLTMKPFRLGSILIDSLELRQEAGQIMADLAAHVGETIYLLVPMQRYAVCLERIEGSTVSLMTLKIGGALPLHIGAGPRSILAFREEEFLPTLLSKPLEAPGPRSVVDVDDIRADLAAIREQGYATSYEDVSPSVGAVGAPVFDRTGSAIASLSIGSLMDRINPPSGEPFAGIVCDAAHRLSIRLGYTGKPVYRSIT